MTPRSLPIMGRPRLTASPCWGQRARTRGPAFETSSCEIAGSPARYLAPPSRLRDGCSSFRRIAAGMLSWRLGLKRLISLDISRDHLSHGVTACLHGVRPHAGRVQGNQSAKDHSSRHSCANHKQRSLEHPAHLQRDRPLVGAPVKPCKRALLSSTPHCRTCLSCPNPAPRQCTRPPQMIAQRHRGSPVCMSRSSPSRFRVYDRV